MPKRKQKKICLMSILLICLCWLGFLCQAAEGVNLRIKDIARVDGVRDNQLNGIGLVVGLNGTGDSSRSPVSVEMVANLLAANGIQINPGDLRVRNVAAVSVSAILPPFKRSGDQIDIHVASIGDAKSLQGGYLLQAPLSGANGKVYAVAQRALVIGGYMASGGRTGARATKNHTTQAVIPGGAIVERTVPMEFTAGGAVRWVLHKPDFTTATRLAKTINDHFRSEQARALDMSLVEVTVPSAYQGREVELISALEGLSVTPDNVAKVVVNERNGTIVVGEDVRIAPVAVSRGGITVQVSSRTAVSQPPALSEGQTVVTVEEEVSVFEEEGPLIALPVGATINEIVRALNAVGAKPQEIIAILLAIEQAGALYGILEIV